MMTKPVSAICALLLLSLLAPVFARTGAAGAPPRPHAGTVPLDLAQVARASGADLRLADPDMTLAGKRVRFLGRLVSIEAVADGRQLATFASGGATVTLRFPGRLDGAERLSPDRDWEVIARLDTPVALEGGRAAIAVAPDALVKTPGPPSFVRPDDVVVTVAGETLFLDPALPPHESESPLFRTRVLHAGRPGDFTQPGASALAYVTDEKGARVLEYRSSARAEDGHGIDVRCQFRVVDGHLRSLALGTWRTAPGGGEPDKDWVDFEDDRFHDRWSARERPFPANVYASSCLLPAISGFPLGTAQVVRFWIWGGSQMPTPLYAYRDGEETIDVRGRPERAVRIRTGLDVREASRAIDVPEKWRDAAEAGSEVWYAGESTWWIAAEAPHEVLRYRGLLGAPGSAEVETDRSR